MDILSRADEILLLAILRLKDKAYGVTIVDEVESRTGKTLTFGSLWVSLDILYKRGLVHKRMADATSARGGRKKIFYTVTKDGLLALERTRLFQNEIWRGVPSLIRKAREAT